MKKYFTIILSIFLFALLSLSNEGFDQMAVRVGKGKAPFLSIKEFKELLVSKKNVLILDTREDNEFSVSHIENSVCVSYSKFSIGTMTKYPKDNLIIVCYCSVGKRSQKIATKILDAGFKKVYNLYGGIFHWINLNNAVYNAKGEKTSKVHAYNKDWGKWLTKGEKVFN